MSTKPLTLADASDLELRMVREAFAERYRGVDRDGWGSFTVEHQGAVEIDRLMKWARRKAKGVEAQKEFAT